MKVLKGDDSKIAISNGRLKLGCRCRRVLAGKLDSGAAVPIAAASGSRSAATGARRRPGQLRDLGRQRGVHQPRDAAAGGARLAAWEARRRRWMQGRELATADPVTPSGGCGGRRALEQRRSVLRARWVAGEQMSRDPSLIQNESPV